jgi:hypothetical protein
MTHEHSPRVLWRLPLGPSGVADAVIVRSAESVTVSIRRDGHVVNVRAFKSDNEALAWAEEVHRLTETEAERGRPRRD